ncbi:Octopine transport system permease protein OccQ [Paraburkholderia domus]|jgi:amine acid ABC transporter, permease protein, 3-TM region, His/Glu/Gln/Arg/opine family|nr:Octopine transport system permease protein OccQ [Paraburkholderia domus]CAE6794306.1 Octopine transport system permease protein OccQ [Paraburkholderia domus]CAE6865129.1 Octopine transport system permease protein OccQ [Paraburkholderia aspalathi]CAE6882256.1 Octopine transport system permease protein OccQ [Paraburkholderia domus]CAG4885842.1 Octopine transport system permease protein OccQ [Paraburkholderia saeva]
MVIVNQLNFIQVVGFGPNGWGLTLLSGAVVTIAVAICGMFLGMVFGTLGAWAKASRRRPFAGIADAYTTIIRGLPDLLIIYVIYFGGSAVLTWLQPFLGSTGFVNFPGFLAGTIAIGVTSGAQSTEVLRGGLNAVNKGEIEAARACGMRRLLRFRRIVAPLTLRHALPGMGNVWLSALKESSLLSVTGLAELMRQAQVGAGSTRLPFDFYVAAALIYFVLCAGSTLAIQRVERHQARSLTGRA